MSQTKETDKRAAAVAAEQDAAATEVSADIVARASGGLGFWACMALSLAIHAGLLLTTSVSDIKNLVAGKPMVSPIGEEAAKPAVTPAVPSTLAKPPATTPKATGNPPPARPPTAPASTTDTGSDSLPAGTSPGSKLLQQLEEKLPPQPEPDKKINLGDAPDIGIK